jgi:hypothetical protein
LPRAHHAPFPAGWPTLGRLLTHIPEPPPQMHNRNWWKRILMSAKDREHVKNLETQLQTVTQLFGHMQVATLESHEVETTEEDEANCQQLAEWASSNDVGMIEAMSGGCGAPSSRARLRPTLAPCYAG